jgi:hypothetical protein
MPGPPCSSSVGAGEGARRCRSANILNAVDSELGTSVVLHRASSPATGHPPLGPTQRAQAQHLVTCRVLAQAAGWTTHWCSRYSRHGRYVGAGPMYLPRLRPRELPQDLALEHNRCFPFICWILGWTWWTETCLWLCRRSHHCHSGLLETLPPCLARNPAFLPFEPRWMVGETLQSVTSVHLPDTLAEGPEDHSPPTCRSGLGSTSFLLVFPHRPSEAGLVKRPEPQVLLGNRDDSDSCV